MGNLILTALYFFLPAYIANMAPVLFKWVPFLDIPIWEKKVGKNKTWRGLIFGTLIGGLVFFCQKLAYNSGFVKWSLIDYSDFSIVFGFLLGFGALAGDAVESFYKRKGGLKEGQSWFIFDQLDFIIGGVIAGFLIYVPPASIVLVLLIVSPILHITVNYIGYLLKINKTKF
jgi:CDP-2,3-bis-(O-geranylgeranyl)-sn-glycerol synthase